MNGVLESAKTKTGLKWYLLCTLIVDGLIGAHIYLKKAKVNFYKEFRIPSMFDSTLSHLNDILENVLAYDQSDSPAISMGNGAFGNNYSYARWMDCSRKGILPWLTH